MKQIGKVLGGIVGWWSIPIDATRSWKLKWFFLRISFPFLGLSGILSLTAAWHSFANALATIAAIGGGALAFAVIFGLGGILRMNLDDGPRDSRGWDFWGVVMFTCLGVSLLGGICFVAFCIAAVGGWLPSG